MSDDDRTDRPAATPAGTDRVDLAPAAERVAAVLAGITDDQLAARTPCEKYTVGALLDHFMGLTTAFRHAAGKTAPPGPREPGATGPGPVSAEALDPAWREELPRRLDALVAAWREPGAFEGVTEVGGVTLPASVIAVFGLDELVLHGWDLARATGQPYQPDPASVRAIFRVLAESASDEGTEGLFGPKVDVPPDAPLFDRALGLSGRDPSWTP
ncbi:TIGR03086 family metal-binding protein [Streptomyces sp. NPDC018031]|uniref:TIGR03086 family metal-binding protein n=1 Tax=Streptomyces sp. NPDC018031 TaxID=3365033 RepID=UPI0037915692